MRENSWKRILLTMLLFGAIFIVPGVTVQAQVKTYQNFDYEELEDGNWRIVGGDPVKHKVTGKGTLMFPEKTVEIAPHAFKGSDVRLVAFASDKNTVTIGEGAFEDCESLESVGYYQEDGKETSYYGTYKEIPKDAFKNCKKLERVIVPDANRKIGESAFEGCVSLKEIKRGSFYSATIGANAFKNCRSLKGDKESVGKVDYDSYVAVRSDRVSEGAFYGCESFDSVRFISKDATVLPKDLFAGCTGIVEMKIENDGSEVTSLNGMTFDGFEKLEEIEVPAGDTVLPENFARNCKSLKKITFAGDVTEVGTGAFSGCESLQEVNLPESVKVLRDSSFRDCKALTKVNLPASLEEIGAEIFSGCPGIGAGNLAGTEDGWPAGLKTIAPSAFTSCGENGLAGTVDMRNCSGLKEIGAEAFFGGFTPTIEKLVLPVGLEKIGDHAFSYAGISELVLPDGLISVGTGAFEHSGKMATVEVPESVKDVPLDAFAYCGSDRSSNPQLTLTVYEGSPLAAYEKKSYTQVFRKLRVNYAFHILPAVQTGEDEAADAPGADDKAGSSGSAAETGSTVGSGAVVAVIILSIIVVFAGVGGFVVFRKKNQKME